jgi:cytochrome c1
MGLPRNSGDGLEVVVVVQRRQRRQLRGCGDDEIYRYYGCRSCHGDNGVGIADLRGANRKYSADAELRRWIEDPSAIQPGTKMPTWRGVIAEEHYAPLVAYVRALGERAAGAKPN